MAYEVQCSALKECTEDELKVYNEKTEYFNEKGNHECVTFVRSVVSMPETTLWRKSDVQVKTAKPGEIRKGTVIATFNDEGRYPDDTDTLGKHAAIYLSHNSEYIEVYDQYKSQGKVLKRKIRFNQSPTKRRSNNGDTFWVVDAVK